MRSSTLYCFAACVSALIAGAGLIAGCPATPSDSGCDPPFVGEDFCGACNGTCFYCPTGTCADACALDAGANCLAAKSVAPRKSKPLVLGISRAAEGGHEVALDARLNVPAGVTWFSSLEGRLETAGDVGTVCLSAGKHVLTYRAAMRGSDEVIVPDEPLIIELN